MVGACQGSVYGPMEKEVDSSGALMDRGENVRDQGSEEMEEEE